MSQGLTVTRILRSTGRELKDRAFALMGKIPVTKVSPIVKLKVLVALDRMNQALPGMPRTHEQWVGGALETMEGALHEPCPAFGLMEGRDRLTLVLDHLEGHPQDF